MSNSSPIIACRSLFGSQRHSPVWSLSGKNRISSMLLICDFRSRGYTEKKVFTQQVLKHAPWNRWDTYSTPFHPPLRRVLLTLPCLKSTYTLQQQTQNGHRWHDASGYNMTIYDSGTVICCHKRQPCTS